MPSQYAQGEGKELRVSSTLVLGAKIFSDLVARIEWEHQFTVH